MGLYNFKRLIKKYSTCVIVAIIETDGYYDMEQGGIWIDGKKEKTILNPAAIVPLSKDDLKVDAGGTLSHDNRKLYCYTLLDKGTTIENTEKNGVKRNYKIVAEKDYSDFDDGLYVYLLERASQDDKKTT